MPIPDLYPEMTRPTKVSKLTWGMFCVLACHDHLAHAFRCLHERGDLTEEQALVGYALASYDHRRKLHKAAVDRAMLDARPFVIVNGERYVKEG